MRLLAVSRSIRPLGDQPSRYKMAHGLPKFGSGARVKRETSGTTVRPERKEKKREGAPGGALGTYPSTSQRKVTQAPAKVGRAFYMFGFFKKIFFGKDPKMNSLEAGPVGMPATTLGVPAQVYPMGRWTLFKNPFGKRSKPVEPVAPVQGELLLDMVRPIRNDLSDSDLELVPANRSTRTTSKELSEPSLAQSAVVPIICRREEMAASQEPVSLESSRSTMVATELKGERVSPALVGTSEVAATSDTSPAWGRVREEFFGAGKS